MIIKDPKSIVNFVANHYDLLKNLFDAHQINNNITNESLNTHLQVYEKNIKEQLIAYQILEEQNNGFAFNEPYLALFEFIHEQFKLLLPEEIAPFGQSIKTLLQKIKDGINKDRNDLLNNIEGLSNQIKKFTTAVVNNTNSLLKKSKNLKANVERMDYIEKIRTATSLIEKYIAPLNNILEPNHSESIYNELKSVSEFANTRRFNDSSGEEIRRKFDSFYHFINRIMNKLTEHPIVLQTS